MNKHDDDLIKAILRRFDFSQDNPNFKERLRRSLEKHDGALSDADLEFVSAAGDIDALKKNIGDLSENAKY